ncbi:MAG: beta-N-acetylhexosaminidase [Candidatus Acidiferrales bacterium]
MTPAQVSTEVLEKLIVGFHGRELPDELRDLLAQRLGGVVLFPRNFSGPAELRALSAEIERAARHPVLIGIDQEGGTRFSLPEPFTQWVSPENLGKLDDAGLVEKQTAALARELCSVGCNLNFAPMLDLHVHPESPVTLGRSFGSHPEKVSRLGAAFARGLGKEGVLACAKHFPGHGDAIVDPHLDVAVFEGDFKRLKSAELIPFQALISAKVPMIMTAHISVPEIDAEFPASLSRKVLNGILRGAEFDGVILADDLAMGALAKTRTPVESAVLTFQAGSDMALLCHDWKLVAPTLDRLSLARSRGEFDDAEWQASHKRIEGLRQRLKSTGQAPRALEVVGCKEHRAIAEEIRSQLAN